MMASGWVLLLIFNDLFTPYDIISWSAFALIFLLALRLPGRRYIIFFAGIVTVVVGSGLLFTNEVHLNTLELVLRLIAIPSVWIVAYLSLRYKSVVDKIKKQNGRLEAIFQNAQEGMIISDSSAKIVMINNYCTKLFGYGNDELIGEKVEKLVPMAQREKHVQHRDGFIQSPSNRQMAKLTELNGCRKDGTLVPVEISLGYFKDDDQTFTIAFVSDISERKRTERQLIRERELTQLSFAVAPVIMLILDKSGVINSINKFGCNVLGYNATDLVGKNWFNLVIPKEKSTEIQKIFETVLAGKNGTSHEHFILTKDKRKILVRWKNELINDESGRIIGTLSAGEDITELRRQERINIENQQSLQVLNTQLEERVKYRTLAYTEVQMHLEKVNKDLLVQIDQRASIERELERNQKLYGIMAHNFPSGIIGILNRDHRYILVDGTELRRLGLDKREMIGRKIFDNLFPIATELAEKELNRAFEGESTNLELTVKGNPYYISMVPLPDSQDQINEVLIVISNVSDVRKAEDDLRKNLEREKDLSDLKSRFITMASHEFRTPLSTILSSLFLLEKYNGEELNEKKDKHINRMKNTVNHLTDILNDFLSLGRLDEGKVRMSSNETHIVEYINAILKEIDSMRKTDQDISYLHNGGSIVHIDKMLLKNIVINLVYNAIKYSPSGSKIEINSEIGEHYFKLKVKDFGMGIPQESQPRIFERFYRAKNVVGIQGTGLGLHLVKKYCQLMDGDISFQSNERTGTTFEIQFPVKNTYTTA